MERERATGRVNGRERSRRRGREPSKKWFL